MPPNIYDRKYLKAIDAQVHDQQRKIELRKALTLGERNQPGLIK